MNHRVELARPSARWARSFLAAVRRSRELHRPWVAPPSTPAAYRGYLRRMRQAGNAGYFLRLRGSGELVGVVNISEIVLGAFRSGYLGYYVFAPHQRQGLMTEGLSLVLDDALRRRGLHRLEANLQPGNEASIRLVARLGFPRRIFAALPEDPGTVARP
jgi:ribosomal-protein-alanine N-acetyltransferase